MDLGQQVDADGTVVTLAGEVHLDKGRGHNQLLSLDAHALPEHRNRAIGCSSGAAARPEIPRQHARGDAGNREDLERAAHVPARVAVFETPREEYIQAGPRHDAELTRARHCPRQLPAGNSDTHAALNDERQRSHGFHSLALLRGKTRR